MFEKGRLSGQATCGKRTRVRRCALLQYVSLASHRYHPFSFLDHPLLLSIPYLRLSPRPPGITTRPLSNGRSFTWDRKCNLAPSAQLCPSGFVLVPSGCTCPSLSLTFTTPFELPLHLTRFNDAPMFKLEFKFELPRFIAIRLRRRRQDTVKEECGNPNGTAVVGGPGHPTPTLDSRSLPTSTIDSASANTQSDHSVFIGTHSIQSSSNSLSRQGLQAANIALAVVSPIAGAIAIVGSPIQAAINGLLQILNAVGGSGILVPTFFETESTQLFSKSHRTKKTFES